MKRRLHPLLLFLLSVTLWGCGSAGSAALTVATAANMQFAMTALTRAFTRQTGIDCHIVISSSGKLTAQIREGAPYDLFVSADMKYPQTLYKSGLTTGAPMIYAYGKLVLWTVKDTLPPSLQALTDPGTGHIAIANPATAPYGGAAVEVLQHAGIYDQVKDKLVYGESIAQTNQFILSGAASVGFTAQSVVLSPQMKKKGHWIPIDPGSYAPIAQGAVVLKKEKPDQNAEKFYNFLFSKTARDILEQFGYQTITP